MPLADEDAQRHVVALGALGLVDGAMADVDGKPYPAHGIGVGGIGAGAAGGLDKLGGAVDEGGTDPAGLSSQGLLVPLL